MGDDTITRVSVKGSRVTCLAMSRTTLSHGWSALDESTCYKDQSFVVVGLVRMDSGSEGHGTTFRSPGNIP